MLYYKVNTTSHQVRLLKIRDTSKKLNFIIKDELYTERVINSAVKAGTGFLVLDLNAAN